MTQGIQYHHHAHGLSQSTGIVLFIISGVWLVFGATVAGILLITLGSFHLFSK